MRLIPIALLCCMIPLAGCVQGELVTTILPDGSGSLAIEASYRVAAWPPFLGDPLAGFDGADELRGLTGPGFVAWAQPTIQIERGVRRYRTEVFFDDIGQVRFFAGRDESRREVLHFERDGDRSLDLVENLGPLLARPLPLPSPERVGMKDVSISPGLLEGIRKQIGQVIGGFHLDFVVRMPGEAQRADGLEILAGREARVEIDDDRATAAFADSAGILLNAAALLSEDPRWEWGPPTVTADELSAFAARREAADAWWSASRR